MVAPGVDVFSSQWALFSPFPLGRQSLTKETSPLCGALSRTAKLKTALLCNGIHKHGHFCLEHEGTLSHWHHSTTLKGLLRSVGEDLACQEIGKSNV